MIITRTPFRVSLFGGGSDHSKWFIDNGGCVLSFAIDKYCYLTTRVLPPFFDHKYRIAYSQVETVKSIDEIKHPVVRESIRVYSPNLNLEIHHDGDLPARSGIGSSSAFAVGMIHALLAMNGENPSKPELADLAIEMEHKILNENVGWQDQIACAVGGINLIEFGPGEFWSNTPITLNPTYLNDALSRMVLMFTGISRMSSDVSAGLLQNLNTKKQQMLELSKLATECKSIFEKEGDLSQIGDMLHHSWMLQKEMNSNATTPEIDGIYKRGLDSGALGGKILGAGGGGFFLFWLANNDRESFLEKFGPATTVPFRICDEGSKVIHRS